VLFPSYWLAISVLWLATASNTPPGWLGILFLLVSWLNVPPSSYWSAVCSFPSIWLAGHSRPSSYWSAVCSFLLTGWLGILVLLVSWLNVPPSSYWSAVCSYLTSGWLDILFLLVSCLNVLLLLKKKKFLLVGIVFFLSDWLAGYSLPSCQLAECSPSSYWSAVCSFFLAGSLGILFLLVSWLNVLIGRQVFFPSGWLAGYSIPSY
jgi:hypothetical protein